MQLCCPRGSRGRRQAALGAPEAGGGSTRPTGWPRASRILRPCVTCAQWRHQHRWRREGPVLPGPGLREVKNLPKVNQLVSMRAGSPPKLTHLRSSCFLSSPKCCRLRSGVNGSGGQIRDGGRTSGPLWGGREADWRAGAGLAWRVCLASLLAVGAWPPRPRRPCCPPASPPGLAQGEAPDTHRVRQPSWRCAQRGRETRVSLLPWGLRGPGTVPAGAARVHVPWTHGGGSLRGRHKSMGRVRGSRGWGVPRTAPEPGGPACPQPSFLERASRG